MSIFSKFFGRTIGEAAAFALGGAMRSPLEPPLVELTNETWLKFVDAGITVPTEASDAAEIAAEDATEVSWARGQAAQRGMGHAQMDKLITATRTAPGIGQLYELLRRGLISNADFQHGLRKAKLETRWDADLLKLEDTLLSSEELAMMQQQGFVSQTRANSEGRLQGVTNERQQLRFEASGLPPGIETALEMLRRGIIDNAEFTQIVREGHTKTKYTDELLKMKHRVLSAATYATLALKGWITTAEMHAGGELTGHSPAQMDLMFKEHGRPATTHQVWIGLQRGGKYIGENLSQRETFDRAIIQSDIRPEWADLLWAQRYTLPSAFVLRALVADGTFTAAEGESILIDEGWVPAYAHQAATHWAAGGGSAAKEATVSDLLTLYDGRKASQAETITALEGLGYSPAESQRKIDLVDARRVASARTAAVTDMHGDFKKGKLDAPAVTRALTDLGIAAWAVPQIVEAWQRYREAESLQPPPPPP
ncbi:MAG TPA: hypothetical protein VH279_07295 [Solirubrobacteraceae bacterium]|nr:hypothetical protein [Solirubrobacteraceae bacterium]